jgi:hypothetical protein
MWRVQRFLFDTAEQDLRREISEQLHPQQPAFSVHFFQGHVLSGVFWDFITIPFFVIRFDLCLYFFFIDFTAMHTAGREEVYMYEKPRAMMAVGSNDRGF